MYQGFLAFNGVVLGSENRVLSYLANGLSPSGSLSFRKDCGCPYIDPGPFTLPGDDCAPWLDPCAPESAEFAGFYIEDISGLDQNPFRERRQSLAGNVGGSLGPLRTGLRSITVTGWLFGRTCCATNYGLHWLTQVLQGNTCCAETSCDLGCLGFYACCPTPPVANGCIVPSTLHDETADDWRRWMPRVGLVDGPKVLQKFGSCCANCGKTMFQVQFTLASEIPWFYEPEVLACSTGFTGEYPSEYFCCDTEVIRNPNCDFTPPPIDLNVQGCYCEPWGTKRGCCEIDNSTCTTKEMAVKMRINSGSSDLTNFKVVAYERQPQDPECPCEELSEFWECKRKVAEFEVGWVPANSTLVIDGMSRKVTLERLGGTQVLAGSQYVQSGSGKPFKFLDIMPCQKMCLIAFADCADGATASDASLEVWTAHRGLVSA